MRDNFVSNPKVIDTNTPIIGFNENSVLFIDAAGTLAEDNPGFTYIPGTGLYLQDGFSVLGTATIGGTLATIASTLTLDTADIVGGGSLFSVNWGSATVETTGTGTFGSSNQIILGDDAAQVALSGTSTSYTFAMGDDATPRGFHISDSSFTATLIDSVNFAAIRADNVGIGSFVAELAGTNGAGFFDDGISNGVILADGTYGLSINEATLSIDYSGNLNTSGDISIVSDSNIINLGSSANATIGFDGDSLNIIANAVTSTDDIFLQARRIGFNTSTPDSLVHILGSTIDAPDTSTVDKFSLLLFSESSANGTETGLGFLVFSDTTDPSGATPGAAITNERVGSWGQGKLHFKTKTGASQTGALTTALTIDENSHIHQPLDSKRRYWGAGDDAYIEFDSNSLNLTANAVTSTDGINLECSTLQYTPEAATSTAFWINGRTNPFSTSGAGANAMTIWRDYDWGTGNIGSMNAIQSIPRHLSSDAFITGSKEWQVFHNSVTNSGSITNAAGTTYNLLVYGMHAQMNDTGTYDTDSTGSFNPQFFGFKYLGLHTPTLVDTGGNNPQNIYNVFCNYSTSSVNPTITSGNWLVRQYGMYVDLTGTTEGSSTNYGIFINDVEGADLNYSWYDVSDATWWHRSDTAEMRIGEGSTDFNLGVTGGNTGYIDVAVALRLGNDVTNYSEFSSTGDLTFVGTAGLPYAEIYAYNVNNTITISGTGIANKVQVTSFVTNGVSNNAAPDHTNDHITITKAGVYKVNVSISAASTGGSSYEIGFGLYKNNGTTQLQNCHVHRNLSGGGGDLGSLSITGLIDVAVNDTIELWTWNETNTNNVIIDDVTFNLIQIGGT